ITRDAFITVSCLVFFSFLMLPPPPKSTLFPYTTLFRSKAIMLLESQFGISDYEVHAEGNIRVYSHLGKQGRLNKAFVENGIEVLKINISEEGLEDYFTKLVGGGAIG